MLLLKIFYPNVISVAILIKPRQLFNKKITLDHNYSVLPRLCYFSATLWGHSPYVGGFFLTFNLQNIESLNH